MFGDDMIKQEYRLKRSAGLNRAQEETRWGNWLNLSCLWSLLARKPVVLAALTKTEGLEKQGNMGAVCALETKDGPPSNGHMFLPWTS